MGRHNVDLVLDTKVSQSLDARFQHRQIGLGASDYRYEGHCAVIVEARSVPVNIGSVDPGVLGRRCDVFAIERFREVNTLYVPIGLGARVRQ